MGVLAQLTAYQFGSAQHIAPLVITAKLHVAAVPLKQLIKVIALHNHVVELKET